MSRMLRITLMWLMALAVPVQGYAAVAMFSCAPGHRAMLVMPAQTASSGAHMQQTPQHSHQVMAGAHIDQHHDEAAHAGHAHKVASHDAAGEAGNGSCTPCASCCVVAALPATALEFQPVPQVDVFVLVAPRDVAFFVTEGLERPPRSALV